MFSVSNGGKSKSNDRGYTHPPYFYDPHFFKKEEGKKEAGLIIGDVARKTIVGKDKNGDNTDDDNTSNITSNSSDDNDKSKFFMFTGLCLVHCILLIVVVGLVSVIFSRDPVQPLVLTEGYILIPGGSDGSNSDTDNAATATGCKVWVNGECVETVDYQFNNINNNLMLLKGKMNMAERKAIGLFSSMNAAVVCLVVQVISTVFYLTLVPVVVVATNDNDYDTESKWALRRFSFIIFVIFAILLLLMQTAWMIPSNNMLWLEILLLASMFTLGSKHKYMKWWEWQGEEAAAIPHILCAAFTLPALGVAVLAVAGEDNTEGLVFVYFGLLGAVLFKLLETVATVSSFTSHLDSGGEIAVAPIMHSGNKNKKEHFLYEPKFVARLNMWLCLIPFLALTFLRLDVIANLPSAELTPTQWSLAALVFALVWFICYAIYFSFFSWKKCMCFDDSEGGYYYCLAIHHFLHASLVLLILTGFIVSTS